MGWSGSRAKAITVAVGNWKKCNLGAWCGRWLAVWATLARWLPLAFRWWTSKAGPEAGTVPSHSTISNCRWRWMYCGRSEEHTSELQSLRHLVCRLLLEKKNTQRKLQLRLHQVRMPWSSLECTYVY